MRQVHLIAIGAVIAVAAVVAVVVVTGNDDDGDGGVLVNCGDEELATPELVEPREGVPAVSLRPVLEGESVTAMAERPDGRLLLLTRPGDLIQVDPATGDRIVLLDQDLEPTAESGGLGLAISPDGAFVYLTFTPDDTRSLLVEYPLTAEGINVAGRREVTEESNRDMRHLMSNLVFGPDGHLYIGVGDGAQPADRAGEVNPNAQDLTERKGKILRIDPRPSGSDPYGIPDDNPFLDVEGAAPEIFALGMRNPWRFSFDRTTGDLWVADAGEYCAEEVDRLPAGEQAGANLGWNTYEGPLRFDPDTETPEVVAPVHWYQRSLGDEEAGVPPQCAVIGGYVYRGTAIEGLQGRYVFGDYCTGQVTVLDVNVDGDERSAQFVVELPALLQGFGQNADGELYALTEDGAYQLVAA